MNSARETVLSSFRNRLVDLRPFPHGLRTLVVFGYLCVATTLAATLYLEIFTSSAGGVEYRSGDGGVQVRTSVEVMVLSSVVLALGWAFFLAGASDCRRRVFIPIAFFFAVQWILFSPAEGFIAALIGFGGLLVVFCAVVAHMFSSQASYWSELPVFEFVAWLALMMVSFAGVFLVQGRANTAVGLDSALSFPQVISAPFWILLGVGAVDAGIKLARLVVRRLRPVSVSARRALLLLLGWLVIRTFVFFALIGEAEGFLANWSVPEILVSLALLFTTILVAVPVLIGSLGYRTVLTLFALSLSTPIATVGLTNALFTELDPVGGALTVLGVGAGVLPAAFIFVGLAAYDVMNFGVRYANVDGRLMPRTGRVLMYFGSILLVAAYVMFYLNTETIRTGEPQESVNLFIDGPFIFGVIFLGLPYLLWTAAKRQERLIGE